MLIACLFTIIFFRQLLTCFSPKVATTRKLRLLMPANSESNEGRYFWNYTVARSQSKNA